MDQLPPPPENYQPRRIRLGCAGAASLMVLMALLFGGFLFWRMESWPGRAAQAVRDAVSEVAGVQPKVTVNNRVVFEQSSPVLELALVRRPTEVTRETEHKWLGSTKKIRLRGTYDVKAGFDLTKPFTVKIENKQVVLEIPPPKILSVTQQGTDIDALENGLWNKIKSEELSEELNSLPLVARQKATETGIQREALESFKKQIQERLGPEYRVEVRITPPAIGTESMD